MMTKNTGKVMNDANIILIRWEAIPYESSITYISENISLLGYSRKDILSNIDILINLRNDSEKLRLKNSLKEIKKGVESYESTYRATKKDGSVVLLSEFTRTAMDGTNKVTGETVIVDASLCRMLDEKLKGLSDDVEYTEEDSILLSEVEDTILDEIIDLNDLKKFMDIFCEAEDIIAYAIDSNLDFVFKVSGNFKNEECLINTFGEKDFYNKIFENYKKTRDLKSSVLTETEFVNVKLVSSPLLIAGQVRASLVLGVIYDEKDFKEGKILYCDAVKTNEIRMMKALDMLSFVTEKMSLAVTNGVNYYIENYKRAEANSFVTDGIKRNETFTKIIHLLESEQEFENIVFILLETIGEYLNLSSSVITRINDYNGVDIIGEWSREGIKKYEEYPEKIIQHESSVIGIAPIIISPGDHPGRYKKFFKHSGATSMVSIPIMINNVPEMFAIFLNDNPNQKWDDTTVTFLEDVCRMLQSIIYKRVSQNSLVSSYSALKEILNNIGSAIYVVDKQTNVILFCNELFKRLSGDDMINKHCWDYHFGYRAEECSKCRVLNRSSSYFEMFREDKDSYYEVSNNDITWIDGKRVSLCVITDVTEKKKYQRKIEFQANNDFLTGLYNRRRSEEDLTLCIKETEENGTSGAVLFIDLDDFKHINDGLGHQYGDILLRMVANGLQQIEGVDGNCYRLGGDEFLILVRPEHIDELQKILDEAQELFSRPWYLNDTEYFCTMSMGVVKFPEDGSDVNDLVKKADIAMYDAKNAGKNRYKFYNSGEEKLTYERLDIEKNMRLAVALGCDEFEIYIQPIIDIKTGRCVGGESLLRWNSNNLGMLLPGEFIPLAENLGLIVQIGEYVLEKSCELNKSWSDRGYNMKINVNLSVIQLLQNDIVEVIENIVKKSEMDPEKLVLEVTENYAINDMVRMIKIINSIKALGIKIALDDFGTGYSSLNYIKHMNFDTIKVDRTFVRDITTDTYSRSFVKLISELSKELNINLCVEGVETRKQYNILKEMNVELVQGYYFGKPMTVEKFEKKFLK